MLFIIQTYLMSHIHLKQKLIKIKQNKILKHVRLRDTLWPNSYAIMFQFVTPFTPPWRCVTKVVHNQGSNSQPPNVNWRWQHKRFVSCKFFFFFFSRYDYSDRTFSERFFFYFLFRNWTVHWMCTCTKNVKKKIFFHNSEMNESDELV